MACIRRVLLLLVTTALFAQIGSAQLPFNQTYYCDRTGATTVISPAPAEFLLVTSFGPGEFVPSFVRCQFSIAVPPNGSLYQLVIQRNPSLPGPSARITVRDTDSRRPLASTDERSGSDRRVPLEKTVLVSRPGRGLVVSFETSGGVPYGQEPVQLSLRRFVNCPPGWTDLDGHCFSSLTSDNRLLDYATAQAACNAMRSNLLMQSFKSGPAGAKYIGNYSLAALYNNVLRYQTDAWIGLVNSPLMWLDQSRYRGSIWPDGLRCFSSVSWSNTQCHDSERCAYFRASADPLPISYTGPVMDRCHYPSTRRQFACYMPRNGTDTFYRLPHTALPLLYWLIPTLGAVIFLVVLFLAIGLRRRRRRILLLRAQRQAPFTCDPHGRPVHWYGAAGGAGPGHVQHQQQHQPPQYQGYQGYGNPAPPGYYAQQQPQQPQQQPECCEKK